MSGKESSITGAPGPRNWYTNLLLQPCFTFHLKQSLRADLPACACPVLDADERRQILAAPIMTWYHSQVHSLEELVAGSPLVEVTFEG